MFRSFTLHRPFHRMLPVALAIAMLGASVAHANLSPQQQLMARRAAQLDAYRLLAERVLGFQITADTTVRDFVTESDDIATAFDHFIKGVRFTDVRYYDDGSAEADAELTIEQLVTEIKRIHENTYRGNRWRRDHFDEISRRTERRVIRVTGAGAARVESEIPEPRDEPIVSRITSGRSQPIALPDIWRQHPPNERLRARRAAQLDAYRLLLERVYGLEIDSQTLVRDFVTESDTIRTATEGELRGVSFTNERYRSDGVVEVEARLTIEQVVTTIQRVHESQYRGNRWQRDQFENISRQTERRVIAVVGTGALDTERRGQQQGGTTTTTTTVIEDRVIVVE